MKNSLLVIFMLTFCISVHSQSLDRLEVLLHHSFSEVETVDVDRAQARLELAKQHTGLRFQSAISNNDYAGLELGNVWRASAGLNLDVLDNGFVSNRHNLKLLEVDKRIAQSRLEHEVLDKNYSYLFNYLIYVFNKDKRELLEQKQFILSSLLNKNYNLYYNHELNFEEIIYLQSFQEESEIMIASMIQMDQLFESIVDVSEIPGIQVQLLPILKFDIDSILGGDNFNYLDELTELKKARIDHKSQSHIDHRLGLYFNVHYRPDIFDANRTGFQTSYGVRYSTPLNFDSKEKEKLNVLEKDRIEAFSEDLIFNEKKELINLILDYNTKLRQYSNFRFKLKKLQERQRVEHAVQNVSSLKAVSRRDWKIDLEILNVQYELLEIKQLMYLSLLRVYNKAKLESLEPYVKIQSFDESQSRFKGNRLLRIVESDTEKLKDDFILNYLVKNDINYVLWVGEDEIPADLSYSLYTHGISLHNNQNTYASEGVVQIPIEQFSTRAEMELYIQQQMNRFHGAYLLISDLDALIALDSKTIGAE